MGRKKIFHRAVILLSIIYLLLILAATIYSQTVYVDQLPEVKIVPLSETSNGRIPKELMQELSDGGWLVPTVQRVDGPWGNRYIIKQVEVHQAKPIGKDQVWVFALEGSKDPLVEHCTEPIMDGMEVQIGD